MKISIAGIVGIEIDDSYKWIDTLYFNNEVASTNEAKYKKCKSFIEIISSNELKIDDCREIEDGIFIGKNLIVDKKFGTRIERIDLGYRLMVKQECNEWLIACFQLLLLENGYSLVHAAGLEKNNKSILLPSWGGVGKTATVVRMVKEKDWKLLGDDLLIIDSKGNVIPFLKPFVIYGYHESLFPELFAERKGIIRNHTISNVLREFIPTIKKVLRVIPGVLAYARKHNPHSMRVNPSEIFSRDQLSRGAKIDRVTWLERMPDNRGVVSLTNKEIVSKIVSVTILEVMSDTINAINIMCGCSMLQFEDFYFRMYDIISKALYGINSTQLTIPTSIPIETVGGEVMNYINRETKE